MKWTWLDAANKNAELADTHNLDYSNLSKNELLDSFQSRNWKALDEEHRIALLQELENRNSTEQGRESAKIVSMNGMDCYGAYNNLNNQISIDVMNFSSYEILDTYIHEGNHAYQAYCIQNRQGYDEHALSMMQAEMARDEYGKIYNYARTFPEYDMQCSELDSNNKAATFLLSQRDRYQNDSEFHAYIEERAEHFEGVNNLLQQSREERGIMQNSQAYLAYARGDVSEEQYYTLTLNINDEKYTDANVTESNIVGEAIAGVNSELQQNYSKESYIRNAPEYPAESREETMFDYTGSIDSSDGILDSNGSGVGNNNSMNMDW